MAIDLNKLEQRFKDILEHTSQEEFQQWLASKPPLDENGYPVYGTFQAPSTQTAVEWLEEQIKVACKVNDMFSPIPQSTIEQAKQIEKEQVEAAHLEGYKKAWEEANAELQKYVNEVTRYQSLKNQ